MHILLLWWKSRIPVGGEIGNIKIIFLRSFSYLLWAAYSDVISLSQFFIHAKHTRNMESAYPNISDRSVWYWEKNLISILIQLSFYQWLNGKTGFWKEVCGNIFSVTSNTNLQLIQYKILHRTHITQRIYFLNGSKRQIFAHFAHWVAPMTICMPHGLANLFIPFGYQRPFNFLSLWAVVFLCLHHSVYWVKPQKLIIIWLNIKIPSSSFFTIWNWSKLEIQKKSIHINHWTNLFIEYIFIRKKK